MTEKEINVEKLHAELAAAGLEICGVTSEGRIDWLLSPAPEMLVRAGQIVTAHTPLSEAEALKNAYRARGLDAETLMYALWEKIMENNPSAADQICTLMAEIKAGQFAPA